MKFKIGDKVVMVLPDQIISGRVVSEPFDTFGGISYEVKFEELRILPIYETALMDFYEASYLLESSISLVEENQKLRDENYRLQKEVIAWEERYYLCP